VDLLAQSISAALALRGRQFMLPITACSAQSQAFEKHVRVGEWTSGRRRMKGPTHELALPLLKCSQELTAAGGYERVAVDAAA
jgi:hypothetical protein